jgi:hypothetical protein
MLTEGTKVYVPLLSWSDTYANWYHSLGLPAEYSVYYMVEGIYGVVSSTTQLTVDIHFPVFNSTLHVDSYWVYSYGTNFTLGDRCVLVDAALVLDHSDMLPKKGRAAQLRRLRDQLTG